jgi:hypothetical protein
MKNFQRKITDHATNLHRSFWSVVSSESEECAGLGGGKRPS